MDFKWLNEGQVKTNGDKIEIFAPAQSDLFFNHAGIFVQRSVLLHRDYGRFCNESKGIT